MKHLFKAFAAVLLIAALLGTAALAEDGFNFRNGVEWGADAESIRAAEGLSESEMPESEFGTFTVLNIAEAEVSRYTASLYYLLMDGRLRVAFYDFAVEDSTDEMTAYLTEALTRKYGQPEVFNTTRASQVLDLLQEGAYPADTLKDFCGWALADGTLIAICRYDAGACMILYADEAYLTEVESVYDLDNL